MIKQLDEITIKDIARIEAGKVSQLKKWWNVLPAFLFAKKLQLFVSKIYEKFNAEQIDLDGIEWKLKSIIIINKLEIAYAMAMKDLHLTVELDLLKNQVLLNRQMRRKMKNKSENLIKALDIFKTILNIEVKSIADLNKVRKTIEHKKDKFAENYPEKKQTGDKLGIMKFASGLCSFMEEPFSGLHRMTLPELVELNERANEKYNNLQERLNNGRN